MHQSDHENVLVSQAYDMLKKDTGIRGICVTRDEIVLGIITINMLNDIVGGMYGYSLHARKSVSSIMKRNFLSVDYKTPVNMAGKLAMARQDDMVYDFITVIAEGKYYGIVTIKDLLNKTIEIEISNATQLNPLTALPGNVAIERMLQTVVNSVETFRVLYFDIDNFKACNDVYGFESGDNAIRNLAGIITNAVPQGEFVGHVGGDDFVVILSSRCDADAICRTILAAFDQSIKGYYREEDIQNGYIIARNRRGFDEQFPLISLSIAGLCSDHNRFKDVYSIAKEASRVKKECKQTAGSCCIVV